MRPPRSSSGRSRREAAAALLSFPFFCFGGAARKLPLRFCCAESNDLYRALSGAGGPYPRDASAAEAVANAPAGSGVLVLADGYPAKPTAIDAAVFQQAAAKKLRLYVEFPASLPGMNTGPPQETKWERTVVASDAFGPALRRLRILAIHDCRYVPAEARGADLVSARVAGFDTAVHGIPANARPLLFEHREGAVLVAATKLSNFATARYAPADAWGPIWNRVLAFLCPGQELPRLRWEPAVRPAYSREAPLPADAELSAFRLGVDWYTRSRMLIHPSWQEKVDRAADYPDRVGPAPALTLPGGDGSLGVLEGFSSTIRADGSQWVRWWLRNDCIAETSMALGFSGKLDNRREHARMAANLNDFIYFRSNLASGARKDPASPSFGLVGWNTAAKYHGEADGFGVYYGDDNARGMLGTLAAAALLDSGRWDESVLRCLLANFRTTGKLGFRGGRIDEGPLQKNGWRHYLESERVNYAPHYECYLWACFLWAYHKTRYAPFRERAANAIRMTMAAYPHEWRWTNGIQQERARMLLPLSWLVRLEDTAEHRRWLAGMARDLLALQDGSGAIREEIGSAGRGRYGPPKTNEAYGTTEAPLIQENGDPLCDLLYTANFALLGLHEAAAATGEKPYAEAGEKLAKFLARIQVRSEARPELDGAWFRAFEFQRWDYWASNADAGWGAWSVETGWTQSWITSVLAMRRMKTSLWNLTAGSRIARHMDALLPLMLPG